MIQLCIQFIFSLIAAISFGILTNVERKQLKYCGLIGGISWSVFYLLQTCGVNLILCYFFSACSIQFLSLLFARIVKVASTTFSVASLVSIVPGGSAYSVIRYFVENNTKVALAYLLQTFEITISISIGFIVATFAMRIFLKVVQISSKKEA